MQTLHTAAIHRLLGNSIQLDLGTTNGALVDISRQVGKLDRVSAETDALPQRFTSLATLVSAESDLLKCQFKQLLHEAADDIVQRVGAQAEPDGFEITATALPLVRLLIQAQALALVREPGVSVDRGDENEAMKKLGAAARREATKAFEPEEPLRDRYLGAFAPFASTDPQDRSERFVEMHALVAAIAQHFAAA